MVELNSVNWLFNSTRPAQGTLTGQTPQAEFAAPAVTAKGFTVKFTVHLKKFTGEHTILEIPNVLGVRIRQHRGRNLQSWRRGHCPPVRRMEDESLKSVVRTTTDIHGLEQHLRPR